ncbi:MAG: DUF2298 domain-containing protein [Anaerolineae bacterium]|nr:DUF2298 domain-containing protein [Anaerolineae bacterium]MDW8171498.1 DUF2298 domain-containing protein [Anaerolineae bacterium]
MDSYDNSKPKRAPSIALKLRPVDGLLAVLLGLVVLLAGALRYNGLNWDDFSAMHPDERFLTRNLLPNVGGGLEFTPDDKTFPAQGLYSRPDDQGLVDRHSLRVDPSARVGVVRGTRAAELVSAWLGESRLVAYDNPTQAAQALSTGEVRAIMLDSAALSVLNLGDVRQALRAFDSFSSEDVQRTRCQGLYPETNGRGDYFDALCSNLNPHNSTAGFYAYGTWPLFLARWAADFVMEQDQAGSALFNYQGETLVWRWLSAFFDVGSVLLVYWLGARLGGRWTGLLAAFLYACAPLAIQKAHYGTVNSITAFFVMLALLAASYAQDKHRWWAYGLFGMAFGAALAGRINVAPLAGVIVLAALVQTLPIWRQDTTWNERRALIRRAFLGLILAGFMSVLTFRITNPYAFVGPSFFGLTLNPRWLADLASGAFGVSGHSDAPPNWQWLGRASYFYPLKDMALWGMGLPFALLAWAGTLWAAWRIARRRTGASSLAILVAWVLVYFAWMGNQWVMTMRYYLPLYGALAVLAAWACAELLRLGWWRGYDLSFTRLLSWILAAAFAAPLLHSLGSSETVTPTIATAFGFALLLLAAAVWPRLGRGRALILTGFTAGFTLLWAVMFSNIYTQQLTRVQASRWIWENVPGDFAMRVEGAPAGTPLINIGIANARPESSTTPERLVSSATMFNSGTIYTSEFTAPASGMIREVIAPHLGDTTQDPDAEWLYLSLAEVLSDGSLRLLSEAELQADFHRRDHVLGSGYAIPWRMPISIEQGKRYVFKAEALAGAFTSAGSVVLSEGDWDDRLPTVMACTLPNGMTLADRPRSGLVSYEACNGLQSWYALIHSYDLAMSYPVDEPIKLESILDGLEVGDYLAISSNRFYDTLTRNRLRWPMSSAYYDALFAGQLGYELVAVFDEHYRWGPLAVSDQHLPIYRSPAWLNELEADEAFHVYDHPAVFIFQKRPDYDHRQVTALLTNVPIMRVEQLLGSGNEWGSDLLGVIYWPTIQADAAPNGLMLAPDTLALNRQGGTWSERFDRDSLINQNQPLGVLTWYGLLVVYGALAFPVLFALFPRMADRGYGFAKLVGLFAVAYTAWFASGLKLPLWSQSGVLLVAGLWGAFAAHWAWRQRVAIRDYLRENLGRLLIIEALTVVLFLAFIAVRLTNPDLWHDFKGGEKPMDFAMFNAVLRATAFPTSDAWFAGGYLNYYYFGFVLVGSPVLALKMLPSIAYNLIIPTLFALTGIGAFSAAFNIVERWRERQQERWTQSGHPRTLGSPWVAGVAALLLCVVLGNLDTVRVLGIGLAQLGGYRTPTGIEAWLIREATPATGEELPPETRAALSERAAAGYLTDRVAYELSIAFDLVTSMARGLGQALSGQPLPIGTDRWYWGPSRVLAETPGVEGNAITEMPYFTFVYGDLHAHMINLPILLFVILFVFNELTQAARENRTPFVQAMALVLGAVFVGMIQATNTWDWPAFLLFSVVGLGYAWWVRWGRIDWDSLVYLLGTVGGFVVVSFAASLPYTTWYAATYGSVELWRGGKTPLWAYFDIHGLFMFLLISLLAWESGRWLRSLKVKALRGQRLWLVLSLGMFAATWLVALIAAMVGYQVALIAVPLIVWIGVLFFRPNQSHELQFVMVITGLALAMTLGVEIIVLGGDIGRQNTVFKFYMQAWVLFSVASGAAFAWLFQASENWARRLSLLWYTPLVALLIVAAMFPIMATRGRSFDRMAANMPLTLDGLEYMRRASHILTYTATMVNLADDYAIIRWLQDNAQGMPVVLEGRSVASEYTWTARIAINTGLPTVLGWRFHQTQQRTFDPLPRWIDQREANVKFFYNSSDVLRSAHMLAHYDVSYVVVSGLERAFGSVAGLAKIETLRDMGLLRVVHTQGEGVLYEVDKDALRRYLMVMVDGGSG